MEYSGGTGRGQSIVIGQIEVSANTGGLAEVVTADLNVGGVQYTKANLFGGLGITFFDIDDTNWLLTGQFRWADPTYGGTASGSGFDLTLAFAASSSVDLTPDFVAASFGCAINSNCIQEATFTGVFANNIVGLEPQDSIPEPATIALLGLGLAGVGFGRRRSKKAA